MLDFICPLGTEPWTKNYSLKQRENTYIQAPNDKSMYGKNLFYLFSLAVVLWSCEKDDNSNPPAPSHSFTGNWSVDSTWIEHSINDDAMVLEVIVDYPHFLDFSSISGSVIQTRFFEKDTAIFQPISSEFVRTDLDFDSKIDTVLISFSSSTSAKLEWNLPAQIVGTDTYESKITQWVSK